MSETICVPIDLSAYVLNENCARQSDKDGPPLSKVAPITQPNYVGMRLDEALMRHDLVDHIDFHLTQPASANPRLSNFDSPPETRQNRVGVYLHWTLPRCYRSGKTTATQRRTTRTDKQEVDGTNPTFPVVPSRWLIVRRLTRQVSADGTKLPDFQSWVVESNRVRYIQDVEKGGTKPVVPDTVDIEVDVSPFVVNDPDFDPNKVLEKQAEVLIGNRVEYSGWQRQNGWKELQLDAPNPNFTDLTVMGSSNPLFPDYVPHNGGVFSIVDSFRYYGNNNTVEKRLTEADADYFVFGWHALSKHDPIVGSKGQSLQDTLNDLKLKLNPDDLQISDQAKSDLKKYLETSVDGRITLQGSIYAVKFRANEIINSEADKAAARFSDKVPMEPLSIGTTPLDAVMTFLEAHKGKDSVFENVMGAGSGSTAHLILALSELLYSADDSYNSRVKAQDLYLYSNMFSNVTTSGYKWSYKERTKPGEKPKQPAPPVFQNLVQANEKQATLDVLERKLLQRRWDLFAEWWKFVTDKTNRSKVATLQTYVDRVQNLKDEISGQAGKKGLEQVVQDLRSTIDGLTKDQPFEKQPQNPYHLRKDPTLCVAGINPGWPSDFMDAVAIRLERQIPTPNPGSNIANTVFGSLPIPVPDSVKVAAVKLLSEFTSRNADGVSKSSARGAQHWGNTNPFQPLFVEWEATYFHIDRTKWTVGVRDSPVGHPYSVVRYGVNELLANSQENQKDFRIISGRTLILPQPVLSLESSVLAVLENDPAFIDAIDKDAINTSTTDRDAAHKAAIEDIKRSIRKLRFISCPLSGIKEHLLTRCMGTHVKPTMTGPGKTTIPLKPAANAASVIKFTEEHLKLIDTETDVTPYGNLLSFPKETYPKAPFKGITHGQLILTKVNIIDKFGQAITVPEPGPRYRVVPQPPPAVLPCMSDWISPDIFQGRLNTIYPEPQAPVKGDWPKTRFLQIPPTINQDARINAVFVNRSDGNSYPFWHETVNDKPESPVFGWIVINYQNSGLQFFRPDGRFYREVRVGGPTGSNAGSKWLPFEPPKDKKQTGDAQLDGLIKELTAPGTGPTFLTSFFHMINGAIKTMPFPPSDYAAYANALVGKPLALVNVGWSLELAAPAITAQNTLGNKPTNEQAELSSYRFPFKIGDADRPFDGVVGYFNTSNIDNSGATNWKDLYTYFPDAANAPNAANDAKPLTDPTKNVSIRPIKPSNFPRLNPTYIDPMTFSSTNPNLSSNKFTTYTEARTAGYTITTLLIDPYTPIHAYSPILPIKVLQLPPWTIEQAFSRMTAFFRVGPTLLSKDVPWEYNAAAPLQPDTWATVKDKSLGTAVGKDPPPTPAIRLPISGKKGLWRWLQPYDVNPADINEKGTVNVTRFNELDVNEEDSRIRKDAAPYTFVEGYLQLARPLLSEDVAAMQRGST